MHFQYFRRPWRSCRNDGQRVSQDEFAWSVAPRVFYLSDLSIKTGRLLFAAAVGGNSIFLRPGGGLDMDFALFTVPSS